MVTEAQYRSAVDGNDARRITGAVLLEIGGAAGVVGLVRGRPSGEGAPVSLSGAPVVGGGVIGLSGHAL